MSGAYQLTEICVNAIIAELQANLPSALSAVNTARGNDGQGNLLPPREYFIYGTEKNYRKPVVFVIATGFEFQLDRGSNHINATHDINVSVVIEDRLEKLLTIAAWRYQAALVSVLHLNQLNGPSNQSKMVPKVVDIKYSPIYSEDSKKGSSEAVFCKEVLVGLRVEHFEPFE